MLTLSVDVQGFEDAELRFEEISDRALHQLEPVLPALGETVASMLQDNLHSEGQSLADVGVTWPKLDAKTLKIRTFYGHGAGPRAWRGGDLLHSIRVLRVEPRAVVTGTTNHAAVIHTGGEITDARGRQRTIGAFPFLLLSRAGQEDLAATVLDYVATGEVA